MTRPGTDVEVALARNPSLTARVRTDGHEDAGRTGIFFVKAVTRDVSSTAIRARLSSGRSIEDLVPAPVATYIEANDLYGTVNELHG